MGNGSHDETALYDNGKFVQSKRQKFSILSSFNDFKFSN